MYNVLAATEHTMGEGMLKRKKRWPKTVDEAVDRLLSGLSDEDKAVLRETPKEELGRFHHGLGTYIRNEFGLWAGNKELIRDCLVREGFPDEDLDELDRIGRPFPGVEPPYEVILEEAWRRLRE